MVSFASFFVVKILGISAGAFLIAFLIAPFLINFLYRNQLWKKQARTKAITGEDAVVFNSLHKERETKVPRMGGLLIPGITVLTIFIFWGLSLIFPESVFGDLNFLSRSQTWLPLFTLIIASLLGLLDDVLVVSSLGSYIGGGLSFSKRLAIVAGMGLLGGWWFYLSLGWDVISIPFVGHFSIGFWYIPLFILVMVACWAGGIVDGIDGLSGGVFASIFGAFSIISLMQGKVDLATFCAVIVGTIFAFLWFNIPPARFYMSEVGTLGLCTTLAVVAFLTDSVMVLPVIAGVLVLEVVSVLIQVISKKIRHKKIFLSTPIHHHFEAIGWPAYKVTMRFWVIGIILAIIGITLKMVG